MKILQRTFEKIIREAQTWNIETGGLLGGNDYINSFFFDKGIATDTPCTYVPNVDLFNTILEDWYKQDITLKGIYHIHFHNHLLHYYLFYLLHLC